MNSLDLGPNGGELSGVCCEGRGVIGRGVIGMKGEKGVGTGRGCMRRVLGQGNHQ